MYKLVCKTLLKRFLLFVFVFGGSVTIAQSKLQANKPGSPIQSPLSENALLDIVQKQTFRYFWDFAHPVSGMARERSNKTFSYGDEVVTTGGTGFGVMSMIVATKRKWIGRDTAAGQILKIIRFLLKANSYHGVFPHWMDGATGKTIPFSAKDDGADLVETAYLFQGLLCARKYFAGNNKTETSIRDNISSMWDAIEWSWFTKGGEDVLYWHWSANNGWAMNFPVRGYNECLIVYLLAAAGERYPVNSNVYHQGWVKSNFFVNGKTFYGFRLPLGFDYGGPLFFSQYSFLGLDPHGLKDKYADYWEQNLHHTLINHAYCIDNPKKFTGYGDSCWGLTSSDTYDGYAGHSPTNDHGTISPTAALSAFPYTPGYSMKALRHFYFDLGKKTWGKYGFIDAFNETKNWYANSDLAIDEGPIIVMIENYRSGLLWKLFMNIPEVQKGLRKLGFESPWLNKKPKGHTDRPTKKHARPQN